MKGTLLNIRFTREIVNDRKLKPNIKESTINSALLGQRNKTREERRNKRDFDKFQKCQKTSTNNKC